jgi:hypothetical protein
MFIPIPPMEVVDEMDKQRSQALESLEMSENSATCQRCGDSVPKTEFKSAHSIRIRFLRARIKWIEDHYNRNIGNTKKEKDSDLSALRTELGELVEQTTKKEDLIKNFPIYYTQIARYKYGYVCSPCFDYVSKHTYKYKQKQSFVHSGKYS